MGDLLTDGRNAKAAELELLRVELYWLLPGGRRQFRLRVTCLHQDPENQQICREQQWQQ